jgi:hypothetical protein
MYDNPQFPLPLLFTQPLNLGTRPTRRVKSGASETPPTPVTPKSGHKRLMPMSLAGSVQFLSAGTRLIDSLVQAQFGSQGQRTNRIPIRAVSIRSASWWTLLTGARDTLPTGAAMLISTTFLPVVMRVEVGLSAPFVLDEKFQESYLCPPPWRKLPFGNRPHASLRHAYLDEIDLVVRVGSGRGG